MSVIGSPSPAQISALQTVQAQAGAGKTREKEKAQVQSRREAKDEVELRVAGLESDNAVRQLPQNNSEQEREEHAAQQQPPQPRQGKPKSKDEPRIDVK